MGRPNDDSICHSSCPLLLGFMRGQRPYRYHLLLLSLLCVFTRGFLFFRLASIKICNNCWYFQFSYKLSWGPPRGELKKKKNLCKAPVDIKIQQARPKSSSQKQSWQSQFQDFSIVHARRSVQYMGKTSYILCFHI